MTTQSPGIDTSQARQGQMPSGAADHHFPQPMRRLAWSCRRQRHKHRAKTSHYAKRSDCHEVLVERQPERCLARSAPWGRSVRSGSQEPFMHECSGLGTSVVQALPVPDWNVWRRQSGCCRGTLRHALYLREAARQVGYGTSRRHASPSGHRGSGASRQYVLAK